MDQEKKFILIVFILAELQSVFAEVYNPARKIQARGKKRFNVIIRDFAEDGVVIYNWMVGIIAVAVFLVLAFGFLMFNHYVCVKFYETEEDDCDEETNASSVIEFKEKNHYVNEDYVFESDLVTEL